MALSQQIESDLEPSTNNEAASSEATYEISVSTEGPGDEKQKNSD